PRGDRGQSRRRSPPPCRRLAGNPSCTTPEDWFCFGRHPNPPPLAGEGDLGGAAVESSPPRAGEGGTHAAGVGGVGAETSASSKRLGAEQFLGQQHGDRVAALKRHGQGS